MFKIAALLGLLLGCSLLGIIKSSELRERVRLLEDFLQMILDIKGHINYLRQPLITIKWDEGSDSFSEAHRLFDTVRYGIAEKQAEIGQIWPLSVEYIYIYTCLENEDIELMKYPGSFLGQTDYENQVARFDYLESRLKKQIETARENLNMQGPLYRRLGVFAGILAAIIFI